MDLKNSSIKNIVFDLGNVVLAGTPSIVLDNMDLSKERYNLLRSRFFTNWDKLDLGYETLEGHLEHANIEVVPKEREMLVNYYKYRPFNIEVINFMKGLKDKGYHVYILSNNNKQATRYLQSLDMFKFVEGWIMSCDYNIIKPDKRIYQKLFEKFDLNPYECFFVDDKIENIQKGQELGMRGYVLDIENKGLEQLIGLFVE